LRSFFAGQEASTSVVGTALFQELPSSEIKTVTLPVEKDDSGFDFDDGFESIEEKQYTPKAKQFIAFSDNRQAAAFFATYFHETYQGFLYSRITNENVIKLDETGKPLVNFVKDMASDFKNHQVSEMFDDHPDYLKESWKAVMKELIESYSRNSLIGLGLMKIGFADEVRMLPNTKYNLSSSEVGDMCLVLLRSMLEDNAIISPYTFVEADTAFFSNNGAPLFKVENEKIGIRHLYSAALAFFWRRNIEYFGNVKDFFGDSEPCDGYEDFKSYIESSPSDLKKYLLSAFPDELIQRFGIETFEWSKWLFDKPDPSYPNLKSVYEQYREEVNSLYEERETAVSHKARSLRCLRRHRSCGQ
jgi:hypothetical protein